MLEYSFSKFLIRIKMNTTIICFWKKVGIKINPINIFSNECFVIVNAVTR